MYDCQVVGGSESKGENYDGLEDSDEADGCQGTLLYFICLSCKQSQSLQQTYITEIT